MTAKFPTLNERDLETLNYIAGGPELGIAATVLRTAVRDYKCGSPRERQQAEKFFYSPWFRDLADGLSLDPDVILDRLDLEGTGTVITPLFLLLPQHEARAAVAHAV